MDDISYLTPYESGPSGLNELTFGYLRSLTPPYRPDELDGLRSDNGGWSILALLVSDQCPFGISIDLPDSDPVRVSGSVLSQVDSAKTIINRLNPERLVDGSKSPVHKFPRVAVMESLMNAVAHRDYSLDGDIMVTVMDDRVRILSPGPAYRERNGLRNPGLIRILETFRIKGYMGGGLKAIRKSYSRSGYDPVMITGTRSFLVELPAVNEVRGYYESKVDKVTAYMSDRGGVTSDEIARILRTSDNYTSRILVRMERDGILFWMLAGGACRYFLCRKRENRRRR